MVKANIPGALAPRAPAGLEKSHLLLLAQNHLHAVHGHNDAHFLLLNVLGFEFILMGTKPQVRRQGLGGTWGVPGTVCGTSQGFTPKCRVCV